MQAGEEEAEYLSGEQVIDPKMIPDEVVEAARDALFRDKGMRGAIAAALTAWPGAYKSDPALFGHKLILPFTQENSNG